MNTIRRVRTMTTCHDNETYYERAINDFTTYDVNEPSKVLSFDPRRSATLQTKSICSDGTFADYTTDVNALIRPLNVSDDSTASTSIRCLPCLVARSAPRGIRSTRTGRSG